MMPGMATEAEIRLTQLSHGAGCACKLPAGLLSQVLSGAEMGVRRPSCWSATRRWTTQPSGASPTIWPSSPRSTSSRRSSTTRTRSAGSPRPTRSPTSTRWAATPAFALERGGVPQDAARWRSWARSCAAAATWRPPQASPIAGGHSIDDAEPKYGMAVTGFARPDRSGANAGGHAGDVLVLSKAIGTGIVTTAIKNGDPPPEVVDAAVASMTTLNAAAAAELREHDAARGHRRHRLRPRRARPRAGRRRRRAGSIQYDRIPLLARGAPAGGRRLRARRHAHQPRARLRLRDVRRLAGRVRPAAGSATRRPPAACSRRFRGTPRSGSGGRSWGSWATGSREPCW